MNKKKEALQPPPPLCRVRVRIPSGVIIKKVHQCSLCSSNYAEGGYSSNYCRGFIYETPYQPDLERLSGELENSLSPFTFFPLFFWFHYVFHKMVYVLACVCVFLWRASNRFTIKTHFIHLCTFIYTDHVLTSQFCFTCCAADTNVSLNRGIRAQYDTWLQSYN